MNKYYPTYINTKDTIVFTALRIKDYYNTRYIPKFFNIGNYINLRLYREYKVPNILSKKIEL